ncbi:MAG: helix-turn-helix transcriptional regulator [Pseudomonadota bacterium]
MADNVIDRMIARRLRKRRKALGMSITMLVASIVVSYQQIQKYETGQNRVSASRLYLASKALDVKVEWFFE